jgi:fructose-1,6-bisphosphatase II
MVLPLIDRLNENASPMSPSDGINFALNFALNFDVVFQPLLAATFGDNPAFLPKLPTLILRRLPFPIPSRYPKPVSFWRAFMATHTKPESKARSFGQNIESDLASRFLRVVETAAIASARTMGQGERKLSDQVATEAMRQTMDSIPMRGTIVIGEGERDEAPMLYIGEKVGAEFPDGREVPEVDIAVDPLEGTNLCATGAPGSITVLAASERGGLLNAPDCYMEKIVVGPSCKDAVDLDAPVAENLKNIAKRMNRDVEDLVIIVLDRPRHEKLIADIRAAGARIRLIGDGDLSAGIAAAVIGTGVHAVMGSGGAPEGVITAAAIRCLNGYMLGRLVIDKPELEERIARMGIKDKNKIYEAEDLAPGKQLIFAATGVTEGALLKGVRFFGEGTRTSSVILTYRTGKVRFIDSIHLEKGPDVKVRFA